VQDQILSTARDAVRYVVQTFLCCVKALLRAGMIMESACLRALLRASSLWLLQPLQMCPSLWLSELEGGRSLLVLELELEIACVMMMLC
jgi:hypothetical protein